MADALGFIETKGLVGAVAAADAMIKSADVTLIGKELTGPALVLIKIKGDLASVQYAVEAGEIAAKSAGNFISSLVLSEPDPRLASVLPGIYTEREKDNINSAEVEQVTDQIIFAENNSEIIQENETEIVQEKSEEASENPDETVELNKDNPIKENMLENIAEVDLEPVTPGNNNPEIIPEQYQDKPIEHGIKKSIRKSRKKTKGAAISNPAEEQENKSAEIVEAAPIEENNINEKLDAPVEMENRDLAPEDDGENQKNIPAVEEEIKKSEVSTKKIKKVKSKSPDFHATLFDSLFDSLDEEGEVQNNEPVFNSTIERLKHEALGDHDEHAEVAPLNIEDNNEVLTEVEPEVIVSEENDEIKTNDPAPAKEKPDEQKPVASVKSSGKKNGKADTKQKDKSNGSPAGSLSSDLSMDYLGTLNVHLLRKAARGVNGFPIQGREISKANRQVLLDYFSRMI